MMHCLLSTELGRRRIKISELSRKTGISRTTLTALYYDRAKGADFHTIEKICAALSCGLTDLFVLGEEGKKGAHE